VYEFCHQLETKAIRAAGVLSVFWRPQIWSTIKMLCANFFTIEVIQKAMKKNSYPMRVVLSLAALALLFSIGLAPAAQAQVGSPEYPYTNYLPIIFQPEPSLWMGPGGGSIISLAAHPTDQNLVYAGTLRGGVFKSTNRGQSWTAVNAGLGNLFVNTVAIDKSSQTVYAGTQGGGIYKTTNGGTSWSAANNGVAYNTVVYTIAVNPFDPNIVLAGTRIENTKYHGVLYRSVNAGASWERVLEYSDGWVYSLAFDPHTNGRVLAAVHEKGPWVSNSSGAKGTWAQTGLASGGFSIDRWIKGRAVAFASSTAGQAHYSSWHDGLVSYSSDKGQNWTVGGVPGAAHIYPNGISVRPNLNTTVYLADHSHNAINNITQPGSILKSTDRGRSYFTVLPNKIFYSVAALPGAAMGCWPVPLTTGCSAARSAARAGCAACRG
jgi:photosystem II stability/assembly factor-like uncharacterized protein